MRIGLFALSMCLFAAPRGYAEIPDIEPALVGQPPNFSGIVGRVRVEVTIEPKEAIVDDPVMFTVRILGETSAKHPPRRELLKVFGEDAERNYWIEQVPDRDSTKPGVWEFAFRLRAKHAAVKETPAVKLVYFHPDRKRYQTSFADPVSVAFHPRPASPVPVEPKVLHAPAVLLQANPPPSNLSMQRGPWLPSAAKWFVAIAVPPVFGFALWRLFTTLFPAPEIRRTRAMHRAAAKAFEELKRADVNDASRAAETVKRYVAERFGWAIAEWGPHEAESALKRRGLAFTARRKCVRFLAEWDRRRFDPSSQVDSISWTNDARDVIETVEADPCVASS
ncbi:MAG: hypothetical protein U0744_00890 [Gemmataceae bacterium]